MDFSTMKKLSMENTFIASSAFLHFQRHFACVYSTIIISARFTGTDAAWSSSGHIGSCRMGCIIRIKRSTVSGSGFGWMNRVAASSRTFSDNLVMPGRLAFHHYMDEETSRYEITRSHAAIFFLFHLTSVLYQISWSAHHLPMTRANKVFAARVSIHI